MDVIGMLREASRLASILFGRAWGDQTSRESKLRTLAEEAAAKKREAYEKWKKALRDHDGRAVVLYHDAYNGWSAELKRLHAQAAAERD